jgi:hypothetical protein
MMKSPVLRQGITARLPHLWVSVSSLWLVAACGLQKHPGHLDTASQPTISEPTGGGGQTASSSSQTSNSGGQTSSSSQTSNSGGQTSSSSGGQTSSSSGGQTSSSQTTSSGGQAGSSSQTSGGQTSSGGQTASNGGRTESGGGTVASGGKTSGTTGASGGTTTPSTVGVTINGKFVSKENAVVFIHIGHSNMRGQATTPTSLKPYFYTPEDGLWSYRGSFSLAKEPTAPEGSMTYAGPGMAILHSARAAVASGSAVQFISIGYGVGSKTSVDFQKSTQLYYQVFMNWAGQLKGKVTFGAIVIMLGITERHLASDQIPGFPDRIAQLVSDMRADLGEPNLPVLFCDYEQLATGDLATTGAVGKVIMPLVRKIPDKVSKLVLVPTDNLAMLDDHHFDMQGHKDWAARVISLMQTNNWFPWK